MRPNRLAHRNGVRVTERSSEMAIVTVTVVPKELKNRPIMPGISATGRNTAIVVAAPAMTEAPTSPVPSSAARRAVLPISRWRCTFSITTVVASTTMPTASDNPMALMLFSVSPMPQRTITLPKRQTGIVMTVTTVALKVRRNRNMIREVSRIPMMMSSRTPCMELRM